MPKNSPEAVEKRNATRKESEAKHIFDLCGWEVWIDALNYSIRKDGKKYYWTTFPNMLKGLKAEVDIKSIQKSKSIDEAIEKVKANSDRFIKDLKAVLDSHTSLGELEWF